MSSEPLPSTTVFKAFMFTDLVGSTDLKRRLGDAAGADAISRHDALFRKCLNQFSGSEEDDTGDGFLAAFDVPSDAVRCALAFQRGIAELDAPEPLKVRIGIHTGEIVLVGGTNQAGEPVRGDEKLVGLAVDTAARVMGLAQGGQILLTRGAFDSARQQLLSAPDGSALQWLAHGPYLFKGIEDTHDVFEVGVEGRSPLAAPEDSEKAKRAITPGDEGTLGWRPAAGLAIPRREHWTLREKLGEGGFGEVWLVEHRKTNSKRILKFCFDPERVRGLKREVVLFRLLKEKLGDRDDIVQILDWEFEEAPYFIESEYTSAGDLARWAESKGGIGAVPLDTRLELVAQTAEALAAAHSAGVLHKDVKPSNLLIRGGAEGAKPKVRLTDFGIGLVTSRDALEAKGITMAGLTQTLLSSSSSGSLSGTRLYLAPEVIEGKPASERSDIYSLGVVLYQMAIGDFSRAVAPGWERDVDDELLREDIAVCVDGIPERRLGSALELADRLRKMGDRKALRTAERATKRRRKAMAVTAAGVLILALTTVAVLVPLQRRGQARMAREETIPRVRELIEHENYIAAFDLAREAERYLPDDLGLAQLWPRMSAEYLIETTPPGADVYFKLYRDVVAEWRLLGRSPTAKMRIPFGKFRWRIEKKGLATLELARAVSAIDNANYPRPETLTFELDQSGSPSDRMIPARGERYPNAIVGGIPLPPADIAPFLIDRYEVTNREFKEFVEAEGYENREFWKQEFSVEGQTLSWDEAITRFRDSTNRPGPATWIDGQFPEGQDDYPVGGVSWYEAAAYAEFRGKRLPTVYHWVAAALDENEVVASMAPSIISLSNLDGEGPAPVGRYAGIGVSGASDLAGNVREWCWNDGGDVRYSLGGGSTDPDWMFTLASTFSPWDRSPINGFRCVKYDESNRPAESLFEPIDSPRSIDPFMVAPVSREVLDVYLDRFLYAKTPLNPVIDRPDIQSKPWTEETVTIDAAYGGEKLPIHLALPKETAPPYQAVILLGGNELLNPQPFNDGYLQRYSFFVDSGRALIMPVFSGMWDRSDGTSRGRFFNPDTQFDLVVEWGKDLSRTIDYLEQRTDIDTTRLAYWGLSMGGLVDVCAPILATEERIMTAVLMMGGFYVVLSDERRVARELAFLEQIHIPVILMNGRYDHLFPLEAGQKPFMAGLGTPEEDRRHVSFEAGHSPLPKYETSRETLAWLDRYLGPVERAPASAPASTGDSQ